MKAGPQHIGTVGVLLSAFAGSSTTASAAERCTQTSEPIEMDRPDITNSTHGHSGRQLSDRTLNQLQRARRQSGLDRTNSRLRFGVAPCLEILLDLPSYVSTFRGSGPSGFSDIAPAIKCQISANPGTI
jgi:hypothetical protein